MKFATLFLIFFSVVQPQAHAVPMCALQLKELQFQMTTLAHSLARARDPAAIQESPECNNYQCVYKKEISNMVSLQRQYESLELSCRS